VITPCAPCRRAGHLCVASIMPPRPAADGEEPMCLDCAEGRACVVQRCAGLGREESSVRAVRGEFGEINFPGEDSAVVHRTPEQLGIARTVPDVRERKTLTPDWSDAQPSGTMRMAHVKRDRKPTMRTITPVARRAAEPDEAKQEESETVKNGEKCAFEGCDQVAYKGRKYCTAKHAYKNKPAVKSKPAAPKVHRETTARPVEIDAQRPGTAAALMNALSKVDAGTDQVRVKIEIELSQAEVDRVLARLDTSQRQAFVAAGLRAALLA